VKILNVACGNQKYGTHFIDLYPQREDVVKCNVESEPIPFSDEFFDEVYSENLLEHLLNPNKVLCEMVRVLKKGGKLTIITDNASFWAYHLGAKTHYGGYEERRGKSGDKHYSLYTTWHLQNHFNALNLKNIKVENLLIKEKHSRKPVVKLMSRLLALVYPRIAYPQIKVSGFKE
jgi:SAM-dependent methyltransferase